MSNFRGVIDVDSALNEAINGVFGESISEQRHDDVSVQFQYNYFDERFDVRPEVVTGDGVTSCANSLATVSSASSGTARRSSRDSIRYKSAHTGYAYFTAMFTGTGVGGAGCFDDLDGFELKISNGNASFGYSKGGVEKGSNGAAGFDDQAVWNGNLPVSEIDFTKLNIFLITFGYLGVANPTLWVKKDKWCVLHTIKTEGVLTSTHVDTPVFPIGIYAENGMSVSSGSWCGGTIGNFSSIGKRGFSFPTQILSGTTTPIQGQVAVAANTTVTLGIFSSKATFKGKINHVKARLTGYNFNVDTPAGTNYGTVIFQIVGVSSLSGAASYTDIDTNSSVIQYDSAAGAGASVSVTGGFPVIPDEHIGYSGANKGGSTGKTSVDAESIGAFAYSGDIFAVVAKNIGVSPANVDVRFSLSWEELF